MSTRKQVQPGSEAERLQELQRDVNGLIKDLTRVMGEGRAVVAELENAADKLRTDVRDFINTQGADLVRTGVAALMQDWADETQRSVQDILQEMRQRFRDLRTKIEGDVSQAFGTDLDTITGIIGAARRSAAKGDVPQTLSTERPLVYSVRPNTIPKDEAK